MNSSSDEILSRFSKSFNIAEYVTFGSLLAVSTLIGLYYGCIKGNQNTVTEYMFGGKQMTVFPIAMSLISSHISGITLLGIPAEVYEYGTQYSVAVFSTIIVVYVTNKCYLPVFYDLQLSSLYEYLEMRFSKTVRKIISFIFAFTLMIYIPMIIYIPALAFQQVSGISVHYITPIVCFLCIFYTTIGGLKAVVWTDAIQGIFTLFATIMVIILGIKNVGGLTNVFEINNRGQRSEIFNMDPNPLSRNTFWSVTVGCSFLWIVVLTIHPGSTQRFVALPTMKAAKKSVIWFGIGVCIIHLLCVFIGMIMYAHYWNCDPVQAAMVKKNAEVLPKFIQTIGKKVPGLTGLFLSGLTSAALSTMSAGINTVSGTLYEDFIQNCMPKNSTEAVASFIMKIIVVLIGIICVLLVYLVEKMGEIIQMSYSLGGAPNGAVFAVFALGLFFPQTNSKGVICGIIGSLIFNVWLIIGTQVSVMNKNIFYLGKPTSVENCDINSTLFRNNSLPANFKEVGDGVFIHEQMNSIYATSFLYYVPLGSILGVIIGLVASYVTGGNDTEKLDPRLISPIARRFLSKKKYEFVNTKDDYKPVTQELKMSQISTKTQLNE